MSSSKVRRLRTVEAGLTAALILTALFSAGRFAIAQAPQPPVRLAVPGGAATAAPGAAAQRGQFVRPPVGAPRPAEIRLADRNVGKPRIEPAAMPAGFRYDSAFTAESFRIEPLVDGYLPDYFRGATVVGAASDLRWTEANGRCELIIESDRRIYAAFRWDENTRHSEEMKREIITERRLIAGGWCPLTQVAWVGPRGHVDHRLVFLRECKAGERLTLRTSVGSMPQVIVPVDDDKVPRLVDLEPDPKLPEIVQRDVVGGKMAVLLANRRFAEIESWLQGYLKAGAHFASGAYKFTAARRSIGYASFDPPTPEQFDGNVKNIEAWLAAFPDSRAAKLTLAAIRTERAEFYEEEATGSDRAAEIDESRRRSMEALFELEQAGDTTPDLYRIAMLTAIDAAWDVELVDHYVERMLDSGTWCPGGLSAAFYYYDKHLSGPERLDKVKLYFRRILERSGERYGKALLAATLKDITFRPNDMALVDYGVDWKLMKAGFEELEVRYPGSSLNRQAFCRWASIAGDRATATRLFGELKLTRYDPTEQVWKNKDDLLTHMTWAAEDFDRGGQSQYFDHPVREPVFAVRNAVGDIYFCDRDTVIWKIARDGSRVRLGRPTSHIPTRRAGARAVSNARNVAVFGLCHGQCLVVDLLRGTSRVLDTDVYSTIESVAVTPDGKTVAAADRGGRLFVFDPAAADPDAGRRVLVEGLAEKVVHLAFLEGGNKLLGFDEDGMVRIWSFPEGRELKSWDADKGTYLHLAAVSSDGRQLATTYAGRSIQLWSLPGGEKTREIPFFNSVQSALAFDPSGTQLVVAHDPLSTGGNAPLTTIRLAGGGGQRESYGHRGVVHSLEFGATDGLLLTASGDMSLRLWTLTGGNNPGRFVPLAGGVPAVRPPLPAGQPVNPAANGIAGVAVPAGGGPAKLRELPMPTAVRVTARDPVVAAPAADLAAAKLPEWLNEAVVLTRQVGRYDSDVAGGLVEIDVVEGVTLAVAVSHTIDSRIQDRWDAGVFGDRGWIPLGPAKLFNPATRATEDRELYFRECAAGERFRIQTHGRYPPLVILSEAARAPKVAGFEPEPSAAESRQVRAVRAKSIALLEARRFDDLEFWTAGFLRTDAHFFSGRSKLTVAYVDLDQVGGKYDAATCVRRLALLDEWLAAKPDSAAARIMVSHVGLRRVAGLLREPPKPDAAAERTAEIERLKRRSAAMLVEQEAKGAAVPELYAIRLGLDALENAPEEVRLEHLEKQLATGKWYPEGAAVVYRRLHPDRPPQPTPEAEAQFRAATDRLLAGIRSYLTPKYGDAPYAAAHAELLRKDPERALAAGFVEWPRMKQSFRELEKHFPSSRRNLQLFCRFACAAGDRETARALFNRLDKIGPDDESIWADERDLAVDRAWSAVDFASGDQRRIIERRGGPIRAIDWLPDGRALLFGAGKTPYRLETEGEAEPLPVSVSSSITVVDVAPDGATAFVGATGSRPLVIRLAEPDKPRVLEGSGTTHAARISAAGDRLLVGWFGGAGRLYDLNDPQATKPFAELKMESKAPLKAVGWSADGRTIRMATVAGEVKSLDLETGAVQSAWSVQNTFPYGLDFSADSERVLLLVSRNLLSVRQVADAASVWEVAMQGPQGTSTVFSPDGRTIAVGTGNSGDVKPAEIRLYRAEDGTFLRTLSGHKAAITALAFSPDGKSLASGSLDGSLRIWEVEK